MLTCSERDCGNEVIGRYTWPGRGEQYVCAAHRSKVIGLAQVSGFHVRVVELEPAVEIDGDAVEVHDEIRDDGEERPTTPTT